MFFTVGEMDYPLNSFQVEDGGVELHGLYAFTLTGRGGISFVVAAGSPEEKYKWMEDIQNAISRAIKKVSFQSRF